MSAEVLLQALKQAVSQAGAHNSFGFPIWFPVHKTHGRFHTKPTDLQDGFIMASLLAVTDKVQFVTAIQGIVLYISDSSCSIPVSYAMWVWVLVLGVWVWVGRYCTCLCYCVKTCLTCNKSISRFASAVTDASLYWMLSWHCGNLCR